MIFIIISDAANACPRREGKGWDVSYWLINYWWTIREPGRCKQWWISIRHTICCWWHWIRYKYIKTSYELVSFSYYWRIWIFFITNNYSYFIKSIKNRWCIVYYRKSIKISSSLFLLHHLMQLFSMMIINKK
jgi:hypothetical protein